MANKEFCLLHEPWIVVLCPDGTTKEISILDVFRQAHVYRQLAGELPTQNVAVMRLLLAILHAVFTRVTPEGEFQPLCENADPIPSPEAAVRRWKALWNLGAFPMKGIEEYLAVYRERFYLFHPETPFYQVAFTPPVTDAAGETVNSAEKEIGYFIGDVAEAGNKARLFRARMQTGSPAYGEAARWLIYLNGFDVAPGGRPPATGYTAKGYGLPWLARLGLIWAEGDNLFETLMLNLQLTVAPGDGDMGIAWEQNNMFAPNDLHTTEPPFPLHLAGLYTMPFRHAQLIRDEAAGRVAKCVLWGGQTLSDENPLLENMTLWRKRKITKDQSATVPKQNDPACQLWRDFSAILPASGAEYKAPGIVAWIAKLAGDQQLRLPMLRLNAAGCEYSNNTALSNVFGDSLRLNMKLLSALGDAWRSAIARELECTKSLVAQVAYLAKQLAVAQGDTDQKSLLKAEENAAGQAYFLLDEPFRRWLENIRPEQDEISDARARWWSEAQRQVRAFGEKLVAQAGSKAFTGRRYKRNQNDTERLYTAPGAYNYFLYRTSSRDRLQDRKGGKAK